MTSVSLGVFNVSVPYLFKPKGRHTWHYRRAVPAAVKSHYKQPHVLKSLGTTDEVEAARLCLKLNKQYEEEFDRVERGLPKRPAKAVYELAVEKLDSFGLYPSVSLGKEAPSDLEDDFLEHLADKLQDKVSKHEFEQFWYKEQKIPDSLMDAVDKAALDLMHGKYRPRASAYVDSYVQLKSRQEDKKFVHEVKRAVAYLLEFLPDKPPGQYTRVEVRSLISAHMAKGDVKTATLHRQLSMLRAMFNKVSKEHELKEDMLHPFTDFEVPRLKEDATDRKDFTMDELEVLRGKLAARQPHIESLVHLMLETGLRVNECCGLRVSDLVLDADIPYVQIQKNPFRPLKTKSSKRFIPLVGVALAAMKTAIEDKDGTDWVFSTYINESEKFTKNAAASAAANKRIRSILGGDAPTCHSFRHTFNSRLRNVECPRDIRDELGGWASGVSDRYGSPTDLEIKQGYLLKSIDAPSGVEWT